MTHTEHKHAGFTALPAGWYNYYKGEGGKTFRSPCPGIIQIDTIETDDYGDSKVAYSEFHAADLDEGFLDKASGGNYIGTSFGDEDNWQEVPANK